MGVNSPKYRDYFITINQEAECYENALEIVKELNYELYGLIIHDKDVLETGEMKRVHKHIMVELKNPITFESMRKKFLGAHIQVPKYKKSAYQYLLHNSPNSKEKYQYDFNEIITNSPESIKLIIETEQYELFNESRFLHYIAQGIITPYQFVKRFGLNAYKQYWKPYSDMLELSRRDEEMQNDLALIKQDQDLPF